MSWNYAELSKLAKVAGGPEQLMTQVKTASEAVGRMQGRMEMIPLVFVSMGLGAALKSLYDYYKEKKETSQEEADKAEKELIKGIKEYDLLHSSQEADHDGNKLENDNLENQNKEAEKKED